MSLSPLRIQRRHIFLLVEVSDSSLTFDQSSKLALYARSDVPEYWVIDVNGRRIVTYARPTGEGYAIELEFTGEESVSPQAFPNFMLRVEELFEKGGTPVTTE